MLSGRARVDRRVELEVDLIEARGEQDRQRRPVLAHLDPFGEALRQPEIHQAGGAAVEPVRRQAEIARHPIARLDQGWRHRC